MSMRRQTGFTMVELMIALLIGLFLLGGLSILVFNNKRAFVGQNALSQLQDNERLAMSLMTDIIQQAGYFPNPNQNSASGSLPAFGSLAAGQGITGIDTGGPQGSTITVQYATQSGDGILNCSGGANTSGSANPAAYVNAFSIQVTGNVSQLVCQLTAGGATIAPPYVLVNNVTSLNISYGVNSAGTANNVDTYMTATQVSNANAWNNVVSVRLQIVFANPLTAAGGNKVAGQGQEPAISLTRTITLMGKAGISS